MWLSGAEQDLELLSGANRGLTGLIGPIRANLAKPGQFGLIGANWSLARLNGPKLALAG